MVPGDTQGMGDLDERPSEDRGCCSGHKSFGNAADYDIGIEIGWKEWGREICLDGVWNRTSGLLVDFVQRILVQCEGAEYPVAWMGDSEDLDEGRRREAGGVEIFRRRNEGFRMGVDKTILR